MEEQRQRQEDEQRRAIAESDAPSGGATAAVGSGVTTGAGETNTEEAMLQRALALSTEAPVKFCDSVSDFTRNVVALHRKSMTECPILLT